MVSGSVSGLIFDPVYAGDRDMDSSKQDKDGKILTL
jgi:hypothetical protein